MIVGMATESNNHDPSAHRCDSQRVIASSLPLLVGIFLVLGVIEAQLMWEGIRC